MPCIEASGSRGRRPESTRAASKSPEVSPATMAIDISADDATGGLFKKFAGGTHVQGSIRRQLGLVCCQRRLGLLQRQAASVNRLVALANGRDCFASEA